MYNTRKRIVSIGIFVLSIVIFVFLALALMPERLSEDQMSVFTGLIVCALFVSVTFLLNKLKEVVMVKVHHDSLESGETVVIQRFINRLRFCYSLDDFYAAVSDCLELKGDCSVLLIDRSKNYLLYNSPDKVTTSDAIRDKIDQRYTDSWTDGYFYFDRHLGITSNLKKARGFFLCAEKNQLFVFCNYARLFDSSIYPVLFEEYQRFITRTQTISQLSEISATTKEWQQLAETQQSFLPQKIPNIPKLKIATYFRPLVNVSGDYFSILPIDKSRTLLMLGDVSGKGLPAALIMGLVMNTVKIIEDKEDLVGVIHAVDKAIKGMHLQDKYTVLFLGIIDTDKMKIRYINASMSDPIILSPSPDGYRMKPLTSNASLVGILDMGDITVQEKRLFRGDTILIATDGVSEVMDDSGVELGDTDLYKKTLIAGASKNPQDFVNDIVDLIWKYNGDKKLHDDVTMMIAKVGY
ncbi:MAG: SpoIIE family protein phosphatase [Treponema sp.]|nr:SpoIIE family protein phosphatase [Treponema sp.]